MWKTAALLVLLARGTAVLAQDHAGMGGMAMPAQAASPQADDTSSGEEGHAMPGMLGPYPMARDSSGTAWQPDSTPATAFDTMSGDWMLMAEGFVSAVHDRQGGARGSAKTFSESMAMLMASRPVGERGTLGLRAMASFDPLMGKRGYPLLFATGETADGAHHLIDRQHPHDLFMELAGSLAFDLGGGHAVSLYAGLPGEPALGPPTFMHRASGMVSPEAPIGHHWFDSTHITFGVVTAGLSGSRWRVEASAFNGREPDQHRYDIETPRLDSWSARASLNPTDNLSLQLSTGHLHSPEQLEPEQDERRTTASVTYNLPLGGANWASTVAWSRKDEQPGPALTGWLAETALAFRERHTVFARAERVDENELFDGGDPLAGRSFTIGKLSLGYQYELPLATNLHLALGALGSAYRYPQALEASYGREGVKSVMLFTRLRFGR